jgi:hypothetical protein
MHHCSEAEWLALWERGSRWHPIDRALLLCAVVRDDVEPEALADLPIGAVHEALLRLRRELSGGTLHAFAPCPACAERVELTIEIDDLLARGGTGAAGIWEGFGLRMRSPTSRDLAAVAGKRDLERAALELLRRCCDAAFDDERLVLHRDAIESGVESLDPLACIETAFACAACDRRSSIALDIGALLWSEVATAAHAVFAEIHALASAYGWTESEILALGRERRAAYLRQVAS